MMHVVFYFHLTLSSTIPTVYQKVKSKIPLRNSNKNVIVNV